MTKWPAPTEKDTVRQSDTRPYSKDHNRDKTIDAHVAFSAAHRSQ